MNSFDDNTHAYMERWAFPLLLAFVSLAFVWILLPFYGTILWGSIIALVFAPVYRRLRARLGERPTLAALLTLLVVLVAVILPFALLSAALANEATAVYQRLQSGDLNPALYFRGVFDALPRWITEVLDRFGLVDFDTLERRLVAALALGSQFIATQALGIGQNTFEFVAGIFITLYLAFFLIRDGEGMVRDVRRAIPLAPDHTEELLGKFTTVIRATIKGNLLVAAIQGALGGLAFWYLGVGGALLWAVLMAFLSLLPAIGAGLVWVPVAAWFLVTGAIWKGVALTAFGVLVIGLVDNLLRPVLVGKDTRMPDYLVMITTLGGMAVFGLNGFVLGPAIAAMFIAVWHIHVTSDHARPPLRDT
jgi:predicted PurR-regulated permease PerM